MMLIGSSSFSSSAFARDPTSNNILKDWHKLKEAVASKMGAWQSDLTKARQQFNNLLREHKRYQEEAEQREQELKDQLAEARKEARRQAKEFENHVARALKVVEGCQKNGRQVVVLLGAQGSGKTTLCHYLFEINGATPVNSHVHGTKELKCNFSKALGVYIVDTIGKVPDICGMMRVLACVYKKGWEPMAIIAVHTGRLGHFDHVASFLRASKINVIDFSPKPFYKALLKKKLDVDEALDYAINSDAETKGLPRVHPISMPEDDHGIKFEECRITDNLLPILRRLRWDSHLSLREDEGITNALAYYMAKSISERDTYGGTDLEFIESVDSM